MTERSPAQRVFKIGDHLRTLFRVRDVLLYVSRSIQPLCVERPLVDDRQRALTVVALAAMGLKVSLTRVRPRNHRRKDGEADQNANHAGHNHDGSVGHDGSILRSV